MKKILLLILIVLLTIPAFSQRGRRGRNVTWFNLAPKAGFGTTLLINTDMMADENVSYNYFNPSNFIGGRFGIGFTENIELAVDVLSVNYGQSIDNIKFPDAPSTMYNKEVTFNSLDIAPMFRFTNDYGGYFEIGPQFVKLKEVSVTNSLTEHFIDDLNIEDDFNTSYVNAVLGFGLAAYRSPDDRLAVNLGVRLSYSLSDMMTQEDSQANTILHDSKFNIDAIEHYDVQYTGKETRPFTAFAVLEIKYDFAYFGIASCGKARLQFK